MIVRQIRLIPFPNTCRKDGAFPLEKIGTANRDLYFTVRLCWVARARHSGIYMYNSH